MKKRVYLIIYAIIQFIVSFCYLIFGKSIAVKQAEEILEAVSLMPERIKEMMAGMYTAETLYSSVMLTAVVGIILAIVLLIIFGKNKVGEKKTLSIILVAVSIFLYGGGIVTLLGAIALVIIGITPKVFPVDIDGNVIVKEKKKLVKLEKLNVSGKDLFLTVVLIALYATQFFISGLIDGPISAIIVMVLYYGGVFAFGIYVFNKRLKRDFKAYRSDLSLHVGQSFKWWAILLGFSYVAAIVRMILGGETVTANQSGLNSSPFWYVAPLAIIWAPFVEEIIFRGCLRRFLKNDVVFVIASGIIFGLMHTIGSEIGIYNMIVQSLQYVAMGSVMALAYVKTNNICINMSVHCIQNTLSTVMMLFM